MWYVCVFAVDQVLCISQFTLYGHVAKGTKPDFHRSMPPDAARVFYHSAFLDRLRLSYVAERVKGSCTSCVCLLACALCACVGLRGFFRIVHERTWPWDLCCGCCCLPSDGVFGAMMEVSINNSGPVTLTFDSRNKRNLEPEGDGKGDE
jgi:hypothetical protein